jgi:hypothetical protein
MAARLAGLMSAGEVGCRSLLLVDSQLRCSLDASVAVTDVTYASVSEARIFMLLSLGGARKNGRWKFRGER